MYSHETDPFVGIWAALLLFCAVGWSVNKLAKRPLMNWAAWLAGWYLIAFVLSVVAILGAPVDAPYYELGRHFAYYLVPAVLAFVYSRSWRKKKSPNGNNVS